MHYRLFTLFLLLLVFAGGFFAGFLLQKNRESIPVDRDSVAEHRVYTANEFTEYNKYVGATEASLSQELGKPLSDQPYYNPLALETPDSLPTGKIRTLTYRVKNGTLWVWLEERSDHWGCFESCWFADGVEF